MAIKPETVRRINTDYAGITVDEPREAELAVELNQFLDASERGRRRLDFNLDQPLCSKTGLNISILCDVTRVVETYKIKVPYLPINSKYSHNKQHNDEYFTVPVEHISAIGILFSQTQIASF